MPKSIPPQRLAAQALRELKAAADPRVAAGAKAYFKAYEDLHFFGVKTPAVRQLARKLFLQIRDLWEIEDALSFCQILIERRELEAKNVGIFLFARYKKSFDKSLLPRFEAWLANNHCSDWASTDALSGAIIGPLIEQHPQLIGQLKVWTRKRSLWVRRAAAVAMVGSARHGEHLDEIYEIAESLLQDPEDLIHKAAGWLLREAGKSDVERLERFLLGHGPRIPRTTLRYAIEKYPPAKRKLLLEKTRFKDPIWPI